jgi:Spy/CpxP family protein refolding chaperone
MRAMRPVTPASSPDNRERRVNRPLLLASVAFALMTATSLAQSQQPYAGLEARAIKALSEQQIADLRAGRGMGLALAAELNGYPGPMHVLELGDPLRLTEQQRGKMEELLAAMKAEAIPLGERLIAQEADLDQQFASKTITAASLVAATDAIGATHATLRRTHLKYHLLTLDVLTPAQAQHYAELRGYKAGMQHPHGPR